MKREKWEWKNGNGIENEIPREKIGIHMLKMPARFTNERIVE